MNVRKAQKPPVPDLRLGGGLVLLPTPALSGSGRWVGGDDDFVSATLSAELPELPTNM